MNPNLLSKLEFSLLSGHAKTFSQEQVDIHNKVYAFWREMWRDIFTQSNSLESLDTDDFFRQHFVQALTCEGQVVGCSFSTQFHLKTTFFQDLSYFSSFNKKAYDFLIQNNCSTSLSIEYLTAHPEWRKSEIGVSLGAVLVGLGLKNLEHLGLDIALGATRKDIKVNSFCSQWGFQVLVPSIMKCNYECELVAALRKKIVVFPDLTTRNLVDQLWNERRDFTSPSIDQYEEIKKAA